MDCQLELQCKDKLNSYKVKIQFNCSEVGMGGGGGGGATAPPTFSNGGPGPSNFHGSARLGDSFPKQNKFNDLRTFILINSTKWLFF